MAGNYSVFPSSSSGGSGNLSSISFSIGVYDSKAPVSQGASVSSNSIFLQSATSTLPGMISSNSQTFAGVKTFSSAPNFSSLTASLPIQTDGSMNAISLGIALNSLTQTTGSLSLTGQVIGVLPANNVIGINALNGSVSLTTQVSGILPLANTSLIPIPTQTTGSLSLTTQVVGVLPAANLPAGTQIGSVSLTAQVSGILPAANLPTGTQIGSVSLTTQISGTLPIANGGTNAITANAGFNNLSPMTTLGDTIGGGAAGLGTRVGGQTTNSTSFYTSIGSGGASTLPIWTIVSPPTKQIFTALGSNSYFTPANCKLIKITVTGGGGGGGGVTSIVSDAAGGGGGGGGGTAIKWLTPTALQVYALIIGAGGPGGASGGNSGSVGSQSIFGGTYIGGGGGAGGAGAATASTTVTGGLGVAGTATSGDINMTGGAGGVGISFGGTSAALGGDGGSSFFGAGPLVTLNTADGAAGVNFGSGGSGGAQVNNGGAKAGGAGASGIILIEEYYL